MDIELGDEPNGIKAGKAIKSATPSTGIVLLSSHDDKEFVTDTIGDNPSGWSYLLKQNVRDAGTLVRAIQGSSWGIAVVDPQLIEGLKPSDDTPLGNLTEDQVRILQMLSQGDTNEAIAKKPNLTDALNVAHELDVIYLALGIPNGHEVDSRVRAVVTYLEQTQAR